MLPEIRADRDTARDRTIHLKSEFAHIEIAPDETAKGPRLMVKDVKTQIAIYLDPLELESLAWSVHHDFRPLLDPDRFNDPNEGEFEEVLKRLQK